RLWDEIRERTLGSSAPAMIQSDSDLIKRAIRDIYNRDIEEVVVEGEAGYRAARDFMKLLMPSHARRVKPYVDPVPLYQRYGAEDQLSAMYDPVVQLKSGGYLVINPTEALVSIDINSGRSTKEHGIEATAVSTNLEAAREIGRQLRLRDMAGLVVIDFIDMEYGSNVRKVEKAMKDALKNDRARIQVGRISGFGLMEMSRQRLRTGVLEATTRACPHCDGSGLVRTASSAGLSALRMIEDEAAKGKGTIISLFASQEAAVYVLNAKRADLQEIEHRYGVRVEVIPEGENEGAKMRVASSGPRPLSPPKFEPIAELAADLDFEDDDESFDEDEAGDDGDSRDEQEPRRANGEGDGDGDAGRRKRRKRRRGGRNRVGGEGSEETGDETAEAQTADNDDDAEEAEGAEGAAEFTGEDGESPRKRRRRGRRRRGGRNRTEGLEAGEEGDGSGEDGPEAEIGAEAPMAAAEITGDGAGEAALPAETAPELEGAPEAAAEPAPKKRTRRKKADTEAAAAETVADVEAEGTEPSVTEAEAPKKPARARRTKAAAADAPAEVAPKKAPRSRKKPVEAPVEAQEADTSAPDQAPAEEVQAEPAAQMVTPAAAPAPAASSSAPEAASSQPASDQGESESANGEPRRGGWWQRTFGA
ncbi:MAG: ribonuclease E/G, partial [Sphingomonadales bacterium]|nr:ribonuclease E/G [Sphingomonadales bacterium]